MLSLLLASFVTFFVAIDPVAMAPMFTTMTNGMTPEWRRKMALKSIAIATGILLAFAFGGAWLLEQIHVSIDAFRIAGGILLFLIAVDMLFEKRAERREERVFAVGDAHAGAGEAGVDHGADQGETKDAEHPFHSGQCPCCRAVGIERSVAHGGQRLHAHAEHRAGPLHLFWQ